jgi:hypothetical protein
LLKSIGSRAYGDIRGSRGCDLPGSCRRGLAKAACQELVLGSRVKVGSWNLIITLGTAPKCERRGRGVLRGLPIRNTGNWVAEVRTAWKLVIMHGRGGDLPKEVRAQPAVVAATSSTR